MQKIFIILILGLIVLGSMPIHARAHSLNDDPTPTETVTPTATPVVIGTAYIQGSVSYVEFSSVMIVACIDMVIFMAFIGWLLVRLRRSAQ